MAKVKQNAILQGISGILDKELVFRQMKDGRTIISTKPDFSNRTFSKEQLAHQRRFQEAAAYARDAAKTNPIYAQLAKETSKNAYNIALSDWFNRPVIHEVQQQSEVIHVKVTDNVLVAKVHITILDEQGKAIEQGEAILQEDQLWEYITRVEGKIRAEAWDLAGNVAVKEV